MELILDGRFMAQPFSGLQRFAYEILKRFASMKDLQVTVALPADACEPTVLAENITYIRVGKHTGTRWEQRDLPRFCKKKKLPLLCTGNTAPVSYPAFVVLHDVLWLDMKQCSPKRSWVIKSRIMIRSFAYRCKALFTVSQFSAERIKSFFPRMKRDPIVVYDGCEHVREWEEEPMDGLPEKFYVSVGSVYAHKNFQFILNLAKLHPEINFVIAGKKIETYDAFLRENQIGNCIFTGYVNDGRLAYLYRHAEGFILPSLYEGFGIPPLEAVACGCRRIFLSDIPVFREIYGDDAIYFDPRGDFVPFDAPALTEERAAALLGRYSWDRTAEAIVRTMEDAE